MEKPLIWIVGKNKLKLPDDLPAQLAYMDMPLPALASLKPAQRPNACLCLDDKLLPGLMGLPCVLWGYGFSGPDGCLQENWSEFLAASQQAPDPGGWRSAIYLCVPFSYLWDDQQMYIREQVLRLGLNVELGLDAQALDEIVPHCFQETSQLLSRSKLTVHMPFMDLHPGAQDPEIAKVTQKRLQQAASVAISLKAKRAVFHLGYDARLNREQAQFVSQASQRLRPIMEKLQQAGVVPVIENVFEPDPEIILAVRQKLADLTKGAVGLCLDVGHANAFNQTSLQDWWQAFSPFLAEMHLHDNPGHDDTHEAIGSGNIDFAFLGKQLKALTNKPVYTLELRSEEALWQSLRALHNLWSGEFSNEERA